MPMKPGDYCYHGHRLTADDIRHYRGRTFCKLCHQEYQRQWAQKHGLSGRTVEQRFWQKVKQLPGGCWEWMGTILATGYGQFVIKRKPFMAHRVSYEMLIGPIGEGLYIDHLCRNPRCVNPSHLEPVTPRENVMRGETIVARFAKKTHCPKGHPYDAENTYRIKTGGRACRACMRERCRRRREKQRLASLEAKTNRR